MPDLTKREYFAALAMQGFCSNKAYGHLTLSEIALVAVKQADALIAALEPDTGDVRDFAARVSGGIV